MSYLDNFKAHKVPGIAKNICCAEQVIAYNFLFSYAHIGGREKNINLSLIQNELTREQSGKFKKFDIDLIYHFILQSYDRYINGRTHIFSNYEALAAVVYSDIFKAA